jgi:rare lipoprotein A
MRRALAPLLLVALGLFGCKPAPAPQPAEPVASPHYQLGGPYEADGHWYYPAETYSLDTTGIASVMDDETGLTADGELKDPQALTAAMQTIQLPAIVHVTNLENGREIDVRVNDRGPASPARIIALSARAALFLQIPPTGAARVRVQIDDQLSRRVVDQLGGGPQLQIAAAPSGIVTAEALPPPGSGPAGPARTIGAPHVDAAGPRVPDRLPERILQTTANPGQLYLLCGSFGRYTYARVVAAKLSGLGADVIQSADGRQTTYTVQVGPLPTIPQADQALAQALRAGVIDARIVVQP